MSKRLIVGNWKMHNNPHQASLLLHHLNQQIVQHPDVTVVLCPPFIDLVPLAREADPKKFKLGVQNLNDHDEGAYTGEISALMIKDLADYAIVGHSERRRYFNEDDGLISRKVAAAVRNGVIPILCVGETLHEREEGLSTKVVVSQLEAGLSQLDAGEVAGIVVAYEPVWAISQGLGKGHHATPEEVGPQIRAIRGTLEELYGEAAGMGVKVLYGGSSDASHCRTYLEMEGVDGLLPGAASLNFEQFAAMVKTAQELA